MRQGILYRTGKDLYRWSRGKSRSFLLTLEFFSVLINELAFHGTNGSPILPICIQHSLVKLKRVLNQKDGNKVI